MSFFFPKHKLKETPKNAKEKVRKELSNKQSQTDTSFRHFCELISGVPVKSPSPKKYRTMDLTPPPSQEQYSDNTINANDIVSTPQPREFSVAPQLQEVPVAPQVLAQQNGAQPAASTCEPRDPLSAHTDLEASCGETSGLSTDSSRGPNDPPESANLGTSQQTDVMCVNTVRNAEECNFCKDTTAITKSCGD